MSDDLSRGDGQHLDFEYTLDSCQDTYNYVSSLAVSHPRALDTQAPAINLGLDFLAQQPYLQPFSSTSTSVTNFYNGVDSRTPTENGLALAKAVHPLERESSHMPISCSTSSTYTNIPSLKNTTRPSASTFRALAPLRITEITEKQIKPSSILPSVPCIPFLRPHRFDFPSFKENYSLTSKLFVVLQSTKTFALSVILAQART
jgi:hypothetical protein